MSGRDVLSLLAILVAIASDASAAVPEPAGDLRVLVWNIQRGSNNFDDGPEKTLAVIRQLDPDVCLLQESYDIEGDRPTLGRWLAGELGWNEYQGTSPHLSVLTPLEIRETYHHADWHAVGATLRDDEGRSFVAYSIWIDWRAYTPYALRDDPEASDEDLLLNETERSGRMRQSTAIVEHLREAGHVEHGVPLLVGGDWNCPSHLDWTEDAQRVYRHRRALPLPVSTMVVEAGFEDAFRVVHPDEVQQPGITWTPLARGTPEESTPMDRIDRLYVLGGEPKAGPRLEPVAAFVLPERWEEASIPQADRVFPSDHAAVVIDFRWVD